MSIPNAIGQLEAPLSAPKYGTLIPNRIFVGGIRHVFKLEFEVQLLIIVYPQWWHNRVWTVPCIFGVRQRKIDENHRRQSWRKQRIRFCHIRNGTGSTATAKRGKLKINLASTAKPTGPANINSKTTTTTTQKSLNIINEIIIIVYLSHSGRLVKRERQFARDDMFLKPNYWAK